jgi:hypothetical protein
MRESRTEPRKWTKEWGKIILDDGDTVFNCTIVNVSTRGACLRIGNAALPDRFYLYRKTDGTLRKAVVKGRRYQTIGVQLDDPLDLDGEVGREIMRALSKRRGPAELVSRRAPRTTDSRQGFAP